MSNRNERSRSHCARRAIGALGGAPASGDNSVVVRFSFDDFVLDTDDATLVRAGERLALRGKALDVLRILLENAGHLVTRDRILDVVWRDAAIHEQGLSVCVKEVRAALDDDAKNPRYIGTEHGRGYRFLAKVKLDAPRATDATVTHDEGIRAQARPGLAFVWSKGMPSSADVPLLEGARDVGRGPLGSFHLEDAAVSRRHVHITRVMNRWRIEDCGSRNGSWVDGVALAGAARDASPGAIVRAGDTLFVLVEDLLRDGVANELRARCEVLAAAAGARELRGSFVERALLDATTRSAADWKKLVERACADANGAPVTAERWPTES